MSGARKVVRKLTGQPSKKKERQLQDAFARQQAQIKQENLNRTNALVLQSQRQNQRRKARQSLLANSETGLNNKLG